MNDEWASKLWVKTWKNEEKWDQPSPGFVTADVQKEKGQHKISGMRSVYNSSFSSTQKMNVYMGGGEEDEK